MVCSTNGFGGEDRTHAMNLKRFGISAKIICARAGSYT